ncbi:hypothetical protein ACIPY2_06025 [Paenarthrobacter sp. NPDC089675]|uniref:hypothetical protein n=1 Tax=Paenarthrobacter sp. NPDC089675 TaxID=3364376 RepID=UPI003823183A
MTSRYPRAATVPALVLTGHHAPVSGWWRPDGETVPFRYVKKGAVMPGLRGSIVSWKLELETREATLR